MSLWTHALQFANTVFYEVKDTKCSQNRPKSGDYGLLLIHLSFQMIYSVTFGRRVSVIVTCVTFELRKRQPVVDRNARFISAGPTDGPAINNFSSMTHGYADVTTFRRLFNSVSGESVDNDC